MERNGTKKKRTKLELNFTGDRDSRTIKIGKFLKTFLPFIRVILWDGYKSQIYWQKRSV